MNILLSSDNEQLEGLLAFIISTIHHSKSEQINFFILIDNIVKLHDILNNIKDEFSKTKPKLIINFEVVDFFKNFNQKYKFLQNYINISNVNQCDKNRISSIMNFARFYFPSIFPNVKKAIYCDCDMIVQSDLNELFKISLDNKIAASVINRKLKNMNFHECLKINKSDIGFNTGIYLFNLELWRKLNLENKFEQLFMVNKTTSLWNTGTQAPINYLFYQKVKSIDNMWNFTNLGWDKNISPELIKKAFVLHWNGHFKPWLKDGYYKEYWIKYSFRNLQKLNS